MANKTIEFILKAKALHGDIYDYSKVIYINAHEKVVIGCGTHGEFKQSPNGHLVKDKKNGGGRGCVKCGRIRGALKTRKGTYQFIVDAQKIHGNKYDYSNVDYKTSNENVTIICPKDDHGPFQQQPLNHLGGKGCSKCSGVYKPNTDEFIQKAKEKHGDTYDYSMVDYTGCKDYVTIICPKEGHGPFQQTPDSHINNKCGCSKCGYEQLSEYKTFTTDEFIQKATEKHGDRYDYTYVDYKDSQTKVTICCKVIGHGPFEQVPSSHLQGRGCSSCVWKTEGKLYDTLKSKYPTIQRQFKADWCKNKTYLPFDFCIAELKTILELDGGQHFIQVSNWSSPAEQLQNDLYKQKCANENGYSVIRLLQEDVLYDKYDWCKKIDDAIEEIKNSDEPKNIYLCENNEYHRYK
jgi:very-short-patch-repair endonuclease